MILILKQYPISQLFISDILKKKKIYHYDYSVITVDSVIVKLNFKPTLIMHTLPSFN